MAPLNICMNKYIAMVRVKGQAIRMMVFADSLIHARLILQYQFGMDAVVSSPVQISEAGIIKPLTPDQQRIKSMQAKVKQDQQAVKAERTRQQLKKAKELMRNTGIKY
jgi:hypothetical protein